jgi:acetyl esterase/lipase
VLLSPWVDLGDDQPRPAENADYDYVSAELLRACRTAYAPSSPDDPLVSPLHGDHHGLPPLLVQVGGAEFLRGQGERLAERTRAAGVATELEICEDLVHVGAAFASLVPEGRQAVRSLAAFIRRHTPTTEPATHAAA